MDAQELTPVENHDGLWVKREDLYRMPNGTNGSKLRACFHLVEKAQQAGALEVVSASSVLSPQAAMSATVAKALGMSSVTVVGGTTPDKAVANQSIRMARDEGSEVITGPAVGYNPALQSWAKKFVGENPGSWQMPYGITTSPEASERDIEDFLQVGARQVVNIPSDVETLILPFGSGNTAAGVLYGLSKSAGLNISRVQLMTIGPDKWLWLVRRLRSVGVTLDDLPDIKQSLLHPNFASYGDRMPENLGEIRLHPTYEGKVVRFLRETEPSWWVNPDDRTMLWIVGGPLPRAVRK